MSQRDPLVVLRHMRDHALEVDQLTANRQREDLETDRMFQLAILHLLQIIGEAANRMPEPEQLARPEIPWGEIIGFRHRVAHGYDTVNFDIVWHVCRIEIPSLLTALNRLLDIDERPDTSD